MATLLSHAFDQYACNNRADLSQLVNAAIRELVQHPEESFIVVQTLCSGPSDKPTTFTVHFDPTQQAWNVYSTRGGTNRSMQFRSLTFARNAIMQMIQANYCRITVQTKHYPYYYLSSQVNLFK